MDYVYTEHSKYPDKINVVHTIKYEMAPATPKFFIIKCPNIKIHNISILGVLAYIQYTILKHPIHTRIIRLNTIQS